jgi:signal transduction histidine kinase
MEFNLLSNLETCTIFLRENSLISLIYYSHVPTAALSLLIGFFVYLKNRSSLASFLLFILLLSFSCWSILDLVTWTSVDSRATSFSWAIMYLFEGLIFFVSLLFVYAFTGKGEISNTKKTIIGLLFLPFVILTPTAYNVGSFNAMNCEAVQGEYVYYYLYFIEVLILLWILGILIKSYFRVVGALRKQILLFGLGIVFFIIAFSWANIFGNITTDWKITQYGLFGMPVFVGFLAYLIVKYNAFNIKLIQAQAIMVGLVILIASQFAFIQNPTNRILTGITLVFSIFFGWQLVRSVKNEVAQKDELVLVNEKLKKIDQAKSEFISIASHQLRTPLTVIKGYISMMNEGTFGVLPPGLKDALGKVYISNERLIKLVEELLNVSRIESGKLRYVFESRQLLDLVSSICNELKGHAAAKGLKFELVRPEVDLPSVMMDEEKMRQVIMNLIDNAIKYTNKGSVTISLKKQDERILFSVSDSGVGIKPDDMQNLFKKFSRGTGTSLIHTEGTGLGLYVARQITEAHGGKAWAESAGEGQGSRFYFYLPILKEGGNNN